MVQRERFSLSHMVICNNYICLLHMAAWASRHGSSWGPYVDGSISKNLGDLDFQKPILPKRIDEVPPLTRAVCECSMCAACGTENESQKRDTTG